MADAAVSADTSARPGADRGTPVAAVTSRTPTPYSLYGIPACRPCRKTYVIRKAWKNGRITPPAFGVPHRAVGNLPVGQAPRPSAGTGRRAGRPEGGAAGGEGVHRSPHHHQCPDHDRASANTGCGVAVAGQVVCPNSRPVRESHCSHRCQPPHNLAKTASLAP